VESTGETEGNEMEARELINFARDMALMKHRATALGLTKTVELLEPIMSAVGWEVADKLVCKICWTKKDEDGNCGCPDSMYIDTQLTKKL